MADEESEGADSWNALVTSLPGDQLYKLLQQTHVRKACIEGAATFGCPAYVAGPAYAALIVCAKLLAQTGASSALSYANKWIFKFKVPRIMLVALAKTDADWSDAEAGRKALIEQLGIGSHQLDIEVEHTLSFEMAAALKTDRMLEKIAVDMTSLRDDFPEIIAEQLHDALNQQNQPALGWLVQSRVAASGADRIKYNAQLYPFLGREREIRHLREFAYCSQAPWKSFSWTLIADDGGKGKTRLAFEFTDRRRPPESRIRDGWNAGLLTEAAARDFVAGKFIPTRPTFIVIDYPARKPREVSDLLCALLRRMRELEDDGRSPLPVRALLLERDTKGEWFREFLDGADEPATLKETYWAPAGSEGFGWVLGPIWPKTTGEIMLARMAKTEIAPLPDIDTLALAAYEIDPTGIKIEAGIVPTPRPLFAAAATEALISAWHAEADWSLLVQHLDRDAVLSGLIARDRAQIWRQIGAGRDPRHLALHENLLTLATICQGLDRERLDIIGEHAARYLPDRDRKSVWPIDDELVHAMSGGSKSDIRQLEPDILGELYALDHLASLDEDERRALIVTSLAAGGSDTKAFVLRCQRDFPARLRDLNFLLNDGDDLDDAATATFAGIAIDLSATFALDDNVLEVLGLLEGVERRHAQRPSEGLAMTLAVIGANLMRARTYLNGEGGYDIESQLDAIEQVYRAYSDNENIQNAYAGAVINCFDDGTSMDRNEGRFDRAEALFGRLDTLLQGHPRNELIANQIMRGASVVLQMAQHEPDNEDRTRLVRQMLQRIDELRAAYPESLRIAAEAAEAARRAAFAAQGSETQQADWSQVERALEIIDSVTSQFARPEHIDALSYSDIDDLAKIAERQDLAVAEMVALHDLLQVEVKTALAQGCGWERTLWLLDRVDAMRSRTSPFEAVIEVQSKIPFTLVSFIGPSVADHGNRSMIDRLVERAEKLRDKHPAYPPLSEDLARTYCNAANHASARASRTGNWTDFIFLIGKIDKLRSTAPARAKVALIEARSLVNCVSHAGRAAQTTEAWDLVEGLLGRFEGVRTSDGGREVALEEAKALTNATILAAAWSAVDRWPLIECWFSMHDAVRARHPTDPAIAAQEAQSVSAVLSTVIRASDHRAGRQRGEMLLARLDRLIANYPEHSDWRTDQAKLVVDMIQVASALGEIDERDRLEVRAVAHGRADSWETLPSCYAVALAGRARLWHGQSLEDEHLDDYVAAARTIVVARFKLEMEQPAPFVLTALKVLHHIFSHHPEHRNAHVLHRELSEAGVDWEAVTEN